MSQTAQQPSAQTGTQASAQSAPSKGLRYPFTSPPKPGQIQEVASGILWVRMPLPFTLDHINLWLLDDGDGWVLVDTGVDTAMTRKYWEKIFAAQLQGRPLKRVIVTHMHPDHVGLAGWITRRFGAEFLMSRTDYLMCRTLAADTGRQAPPEAIAFYRAAGFDEKGLARYCERFGFFGKMIDKMPEAYTRLKQGDVLNIGAHSWRVEIGQGHAPEHVCLLCEAMNICISGDQILPRISSNVSLFPTEPNGNPLQDWIDSCARLETLLDDECMVLPAHNEPFYGAPHRLKNLRENHENGLARLLEKLDTPRMATDMELFSVLFRGRITRDNFFMATGECLAHLSCLVHRGAITSDVTASGVRLYQRV